MSFPKRIHCVTPIHPIFTVLSAAILLSAALTSLAQADGAAPSEKVRTDSYNLQTDSGSRALFHALAAASERVCGVEDSRQSRQLERISVANHCYETTLNTAVLQVKSERLTRLYLAQGGIG
jgi:UrcA family protein